MNIPLIVDEFDLYLKTEKGASENTRQSYLRDLRYFTSFCGSDEIDTQCVEAFVAQLKCDGRSVSTIARCVASLKAFMKFCCLRGYMDSNPASDVIVEKLSAKSPDVLDYKEVELLLEQPRCTDLKGYRDKAMLELLYSTGIRVGELISLKISDVDLENGTITCGGTKSRTLPLSAAAVKSVSEYITFIRRQMVRDLHEEILFVNVNGDPMTRQGFWKLLKGYQQKAGIQKNITPHTLRHSFAAHSLQNGSDMKSVQKLMGHSDVSTTGMYAEYANEAASRSRKKIHK